MFHDSVNPIPYREELLGDPRAAAAWLLRCVEGEVTAWDGLCEFEPEFLSAVVQLACGSRGRREPLPLMFWSDFLARNYLRIFGREVSQTIEGDQIKDHLPTPPEDFILKASRR